MMNPMLDDTSALDFSTDYNWDNLNIGNQANASSLFFAEKHPEHSAIKTKKYESKIKIKETRANVKNEENIENNPNANAINTPESVDSDYLSSEIECIQLNNVQSSPLRNNNNRANLRTKPVTPKAKDDKVNNDFNVVRAGKFYEERKKQRQEKLEKIEREQRKFHSKPAPNFRAIHAALDQKKDERPMKVTIPKTPLAIKHDREIKLIWQKRREEYEESRKLKPFISHGADVLKQKPFIPNLEKKKSSTELEPFNLHISERCKERRQFDEQFKMETERKQKEEEERRQQEEERLRRELRKRTNFKAQPNPFK